jgi:hypothetical protein
MSNALHSIEVRLRGFRLPDTPMFFVVYDPAQQAKQTPHMSIARSAADALVRIIILCPAASSHYGPNGFGDDVLTNAIQH